MLLALERGAVTVVLLCKQRGHMLNSRRNFAEAKNRQNQVETPAHAAAEYPTDENASQEEVAHLQVEKLASDVEDTDISLAYAALLSDNEAFRTRLEREKSRAIEAEKATLAQVLLDSTDDLERALATADVSVIQSHGVRKLAQGVRLSLAILHKRIADMGAERMSTIGRRFDPTFAEAVGTVGVTDPVQDGIIVQEIRPGYRVGDRLLRPAQVQVGRLVHT